MLYVWLMSVYNVCFLLILEVLYWLLVRVLYNILYGRYIYSFVNYSGYYFVYIFFLRELNLSMMFIFVKYKRMLEKFFINDIYIVIFLINVMIVNIFYFFYSYKISGKGFFLLKLI